MTNTIKEAEIISNYLSLIKKSLPLSIRLRKNELEDILDEIEAHIWEKVIESAGDKEPTEIDIQVAISQIGEPEEIATKFVSKSTPYIYISEELYPSYRKFRNTLFWSFLYGLIMFFIPHPFSGYSFYQLVDSPLYNSIMIMPIIFGSFFIFIGILFCYLSITGYVASEIRTSKLQKRNFNLNHLQKPTFKPQFQLVVSLLSLLFLFSAIYLFTVGSVSQSIPFFVLSTIKFLRGFTKRKSVIWQKLLILLDLFFIGEIIHIVGELIYLNYYEFRIITNFLSVMFLFYVYYDIYTFMTLRHKKELYLKELSITDRLRKKGSMLRDVKSNNIPNTQKITSKKITFNLELEEKIEAFLKRAKKKLPFWLKISEKREFIDDIEEEIREAVLEFEESNKHTEENVKQLFSDFEIYISKEVWPWYSEKTPTPKSYISKEVWPWYLNTLKAFFVYFITIAIFVFVLSFIVWINIPLFLRILLLVLTSTMILVTRIFIFLSLKGINITRKESVKEGNDYSYFICESFFAVIYLAIGITIFFDEITSSTSFRNLILILIIVVGSLLLGGLKLLKMVFIKNGVILKSFLIITCLTFSLILNLFILYQYYSMDFPFIRSYTSVNMLSLLSLLVNVEIIYEIFHLFFQEKQKKQKG